MVRPLPPFMGFVNKTIPTAFEDSMSYYETLCVLYNYIQKELLPATNENIALTKQLKEYVEHYFDNLDVQEEINNKLDEMAEQGVLADIISQYLNSTAVFGYDKVSDMQTAPNLIDGSYARTYGKNSLNDGYGAFYKIRLLQAGETPDGENLVAMADDTLVAEKYLGEKYLDNIILNKKFVNTAPIYFVELHNVEEVKVEPTANLLSNYADSTNINSYNRENSKYQVFLNAGVFNTTTKQPLGWTLTDTEQMELTQPTTYNHITTIDNDGNLGNIAFGDYVSINAMKQAGIKNCVTAYDTLILNNDARTPDAPYRDNTNILCQRTNGEYLLVCTTGRLSSNTELTWSAISNKILEEYPDVEIACILDGGGSLQLFTRDSALIPVGEKTLGRTIPTMICFKLKENV